MQEFADDLATRVEQVRFPMGRGGYDMGEVDSFLDSVAEDLRAGRDVRERLASARFRRRRFAPGYVAEAVDHVIATIREQAPPAGAAVPPPSDAASIARHLRLARFGLERRGGYAMDDVDALLEGLADAAEAGEDITPHVAAAAPRTTRSIGYQRAQVDAFLTDLAHRVGGTWTPPEAGR